MKKNVTSPKTAERYGEIATLQKELQVSLENLFELPEAQSFYHDANHLCVITVNELLIYSIPTLEAILTLTHYDARKAGIERRKKWALWFVEQLQVWAKEKGLQIND